LGWYGTIAPEGGMAEISRRVLASAGGLSNHAIIDCDKKHIEAEKNDPCKTPHLQIVPSKSVCVFDDPNANYRNHQNS